MHAYLQSDMNMYHNIKASKKNRGGQSNMFMRLRIPYIGSRWAMKFNISVRKRKVTLPLGYQALHSLDNESLHFHRRYQNLYTRNMPCILTCCQWVLSGLARPNALTHRPVTSDCTWSEPQQSNMFHPWYFHQARPPQMTQSPMYQVSHQWPLDEQ